MNANRINDSADREIWFSVGLADSTGRLLNKPFKTGIRTAANVALACGPYSSAGSYDCVLAYVPLDSTTYQLATTRFYTYSGGSSVAYSTEEDVGWLTGSGATAWYNGDWFLAHTSGGNIQVRESTDGASWSHSETLTSAAVGFVSAKNAPGLSADRGTVLYYTSQ